MLLGALTALGPLSIDMYLPGFPSIASALGADAADVELTLATFLGGMALGQLLYGPLSDRFGRKPPLYFGLALYVVASLACAQAASVEALAAWRFLQALGSSAGLVISRAVIRDRTTTLEGARMFSLLMLVMGLAPILAPSLGSAALALTGWRSIFVFLAAVGAAALAAVHFTMGETVSRHDAAPLRLSAAVGRYARLLRNGHFVRFSLIGALAGAGMFAYIAGSPYVLIELYGVPSEHYGWIFGLNAFGLIAAAQLNQRLLGRRTPEQLLSGALVVPPVAAAIALVPTLLGIQSLPVLMLGLFAFVGSLGFITPNASALALSGEGRAAGSASALMGTLQSLCGTLAGVAVSLLHRPNALPLTCAMAVCGAGAFLLHRATRGRAPAFTA